MSATAYEIESMIDHAASLQRARDSFDRECERLRKVLKEIAEEAHDGGLKGHDEAKALVEIRKMSLEWWDRKAKADRITGVVARCQCGRLIGAMDYAKVDPQRAGTVLKMWLGEGFSLEPRFDGTGAEELEECECDSIKPNTNGDSRGTR